MHVELAHYLALKYTCICAYGGDYIKWKREGYDVIAGGLTEISKTPHRQKRERSEEIGTQ